MTQDNSTYTKINQIFDEMILHCTGAEFKILHVIARQTWGWHKEKDWISLTQFEEKTGMARSTIVASMKSLLEKGMILRDGDYKYSINMEWYENTTSTKIELGSSKIEPPSSKIEHTIDTNTINTNTKDTCSLQEPIIATQSNSYEDISPEKHDEIYWAKKASEMYSISGEIQKRNNGYKSASEYISGGT